MFLIVATGCDSFRETQILRPLEDYQEKWLEHSLYRDIFGISTQGIEITIEGAYQPNTFGFIELSSGWVGFNISISNHRADVLEVDILNFVLESENKEYKARSYRPFERSSDKVLTALELRNLFRGFQDKNPFPSDKFKLEESVDGVIQFSDVSINRNNPKILLKFKVLDLNTGEELPFTVGWKIGHQTLE